jgi:hypothetical protein
MLHFISVEFMFVNSTLYCSRTHVYCLSFFFFFSVKYLTFSFPLHSIPMRLLFVSLSLYAASDCGCTCGRWRHGLYRC